MAERNPLLPNDTKHEHLASLDDSISSASALHAELPYSNTTHPPAEIVSYNTPSNHSVNNSSVLQKQEVVHSHNGLKSKSKSNLKSSKSRHRPRSKSPTSSRTQYTEQQLGHYNLDFSGKIPLASKFFFFIILFGITLTFAVMAASAYLILDTTGDKIKSHGDISMIVLPLVIYIMDIVECSLFYLEARTFQMRGYTQLPQDAYKLSKINFRFTSVYYVVSYGTYAFLLHHESSLNLDTHERDVIFLAIWYFIYFFIIGSLYGFGSKFYKHNRERPKPDLFFPAPDNPHCIKNSPMSRGKNNRYGYRRNNGKDVVIVNDQTEVIQKLSRDKQTLMRQYETMKKKYERAERELQEYNRDRNSIYSDVGGGGTDNGGNTEVVNLRNRCRKLEDKLRGDREQIKTLMTQIETKKTVLNAQIAETQQLRNVLQAKDDRISQLMNDKESLERKINAANDQYDDLKLLYQVKEQEVEIAKKENDRLRKKLQQLNMVSNHHQNY